MKLIPLKYGTRCRCCGTPLPVGMQVWAAKNDLTGKWSFWCNNGSCAPKAKAEPLGIDSEYVDDANLHALAGMVEAVEVNRVEAPGVLCAAVTIRKSGLELLREKAAWSM